MSKFFINRPIVAMVISILMVIVGTVSLLSLPTAQFPDIIPPEIQITAIYPGGILGGTAFYDTASTVYYPYSVDTAKAYLEKAGLKDTDGDGLVNFPSGSAAGTGNVEIKILQHRYETIAQGQPLHRDAGGICFHLISPSPRRRQCRGRNTCQRRNRW